MQVNLTKPTLIIGIILAVFTLGGFGTLIGGGLALGTALHSTDPAVALIFMGMVTILTVDIFLVRHLSKLISSALKAEPVARSGKQIVATDNAVSLRSSSTAQLAPVTSVTENTTRFLENQLRDASQIRDSIENPR